MQEIYDYMYPILIDSHMYVCSAQITKVVEVCSELVYGANNGLAPGAVAARDIGVIAAFRQQVLRLRLALRAVGLGNVNVGSVEDFQVCAVCSAAVFSVVWVLRERWKWFDVHT